MWRREQSKGIKHKVKGIKQVYLCTFGLLCFLHTLPTFWRHMRHILCLLFVLGQISLAHTIVSSFVSHFCNVI